MTNFQCDKIIILHYEIGSGGRFLANCLGLSDQCVFTDGTLAELQLNNQFNSKDKFKYLINSLIETKSTWNDLNLYDKNWTGIDYDIHFNLTSEQLKKFKYKEVFSKLTEKNEKYLFLNTHSENELNTLVNVWPNSKVVSFSNTKLFNKIRNHRSDYFVFKGVWDLLSLQDLIDIPYSKKQYQNMPDSIKNKVNTCLKDEKFLTELKKILDDNLTSLSFREYNNSKVVLKNKLKSIYKNSNFVYPKSYFVWDTNWYLNFNDTLKNIETLYKKLELKDFNKKFIELYYKTWIYKLDEIKWEKINNSYRSTRIW